MLRGDTIQFEIQNTPSALSTVTYLAPNCENTESHDPVGATKFDTEGFELPCQNTSEDLWFAEHADSLARAKELCGACPLQQQCLEGALQRGEPWGVWGGEIFTEGRIVAIKRGRGRPRKAA